MEDEGRGVVIADRHSRLELISDGPPKHFIPTKIVFRAGAISAVVLTEVIEYANFRSALVRLHETLAGQASLLFPDGDHSLTFVGNGLGRVEATAEIGDGRSPPNAQVKVKISLDQSHLPEIIHAIKREFLPSS